MINTSYLPTSVNVTPPGGRARGVFFYQGQQNTAAEEDNSSASNDPVTLSRQGREASETPKTPGTGNAQNADLTQQELSQLQQLKRRDAEVKAHEQAHLSAAGPHARGGPSFSYQRGPDGNKYAVGGEVNIDISKEQTPQDTIAKMQDIRRAALAPANPSAADRRIAAQASAKETQARQELSQVAQEDLLSPLGAPPADAVAANNASPTPSPTTFDPAVGALRAIRTYQANLTG